MKPIKALLVDDASTRPSVIIHALVKHKIDVVCHLHTSQGLVKQIEQHQPDVIIMDIHSPDEETLQVMTALNQSNPKPIIIFSVESSQDITEAVIQAGACAYVVDGFHPKRFKPLLTIAMARFQQQQSLKQELLDVKTQLSDRKVIDKAKGLLMKTKGFDEEQAYHAMRKMAMDQGQPIINVANNILSVVDLLTP